MVGLQFFYLSLFLVHHFNAMFSNFLAFSLESVEGTPRSMCDCQTG